MKTLMSILIPPVGVAMKGHGGGQIVLSIVLTLCAWIPGVIHALIVSDKSSQGSTVIVNNIIQK